jgi:hypothetical protein
LMNVGHDSHDTTAVRARTASRRLRRRADRVGAEDGQGLLLGQSLADLLFAG